MKVFFWSNLDFYVYIDIQDNNDFDEACEKCYVHFEKAYNVLEKIFNEVTEEATKILSSEKGYYLNYLHGHQYNILLNYLTEPREGAQAALKQKEAL